MTTPNASASRGAEDDFGDRAHFRRRQPTPSSVGLRGVVNGWSFINSWSFRATSDSKSLLFGRRRRDGERHFLDPFAPNDVKHPNDSPMGGVLVAADINRDVGIDLVLVGQNALQLHQC